VGVARHPLLHARRLYRRDTDDRQHQQQNQADEKGNASLVFHDAIT